MAMDADTIWSDIVQIRENAPLVHNITNYVAMNSSANALLALGASPVMAHAEQEVEEMAGLAGALVLNIGTLSEQWIRAMHKAARQAHAQRTPIVFDPVGAGATAYRTETAHQLLAEAAPTLVRGNASEINALVVAGAVTKGVDSTADPEAVVDAARQLGERYGCVVCISGATDYIVQGDQLLKVRNGDPMMTKVTAMGCAASALCGAFAAVNPAAATATAHAMAVTGIAGEIAAQQSSGPGALQVNFLDALYNLSQADMARVQIEQA